MPGNRTRTPRNILAVRVDNIGDVIMLTPALRAVRKAYPHARITLLASPAGSQVAPMLPWIDDVLVWRASWQDISEADEVHPEYELELVHLLASRGFDLALIFTSFSQSPYPPAYTCYLAGIPDRVGLSKEFGGAILSRWARPPEDSGHQVDRNLAVIEAAGIPSDGDKIELVVQPAMLDAAQAILAQQGIRPGEAFITASPGASCAARRYPPERFAQVLVGLREKTGLPVVVLGSEREKEIIYPVTQGGERYGLSSLVGKTSVPEMIALISLSSLVLANNSASMHAAEAFRRPMVIMYSGTEYLTQWEPRHSRAILLRREVFCSPCYRFTCPYHLECLDIPTSEVIDAACNLIAHQSLAPPLHACVVTG